MSWGLHADPELLRYLEYSTRPIAPIKKKPIAPTEGVHSVIAPLQPPRDPTAIVNKMMAAQLEHLELRRLEEEHTRVEELSNRFKEVKDIANQLNDKTPVPCGAPRQSVLDCLKLHSSEPLLCTEHINSFTQCTRELK